MQGYLAHKSGEVVHQSSLVQDLSSWIPAEARGNIWVSLESRDGDDFHRLCQSVMHHAGVRFLNRDTVVGRSIAGRFFTRAPGPPGLRNPEWLLLMQAVRLTLARMQHAELAGQLPAAGKRLPFFGQGRIPEAVGVFTADLSGGVPPQWTVQAAHIRNLLDAELAPGTHNMEVRNQKPF